MGKRSYLLEINVDRLPQNESHPLCLFGTCNTQYGDWNRRRHCSLTLDILSLQWRNNGRDGISNHRPLHCLLSCWSWWLTTLVTSTLHHHDDLFTRISSNINSLRPKDAYVRHQLKSALAQIMACRLFGAKPLSEPMLYYFQFNP